MKYTITGTHIILYWNDKTKGEICWNDMPSDLSMMFDEWLSEIEYERNKAEAG